MTVARVQAFFEYSKDKLLNFVEVPSGAPVEKTSEDIEEAELDESWDLQLLVNVARVKAFFGRQEVWGYRSVRA
jgi:hypothetical protein